MSSVSGIFFDETGAIKPTTYRFLPITEAAAAHDVLYQGKTWARSFCGKIMKTKKTRDFLGFLLGIFFVKTY
jgi:hypothetical protein